MTDRFEAWARTLEMDLTTYSDPESGQALYSDCNTDFAWLAWQEAVRQERALANKLADALQELLADSQHMQHEDCDDGGYCPVRDARQAMKDFDAIRARQRLKSLSVGGGAAIDIAP